MIIRDALERDLAAIVEIYNQAVAEHATADTDPVSMADREAWLRSHDGRHPVLVAEREGVVAGWASLSAYRPGRAALRHTAEISYYVHTDHRRRGVATALVTDAIARGPRLGIRTFFAILLEDNAASIALLERLGFRRWGYLPGVADFDGREVGHVYYGRRL